MEILIVGGILVALMAYASTKIKKRAAEAYDAEVVDTGSYSLLKPEGFLHVVGNPDHDFVAYSKEFGDTEAAHLQRAAIEVDVLRDIDMQSVRRQVQEDASEFSVSEETESSLRIESEEKVNEILLKGFYKLVDAPEDIYRLRFVVLPKHTDDYLRKIQETLDSFVVKTI